MEEEIDAERVASVRIGHCDNPNCVCGDVIVEALDADDDPIVEMRWDAETALTVADGIREAAEAMIARRRALAS